MRATWWPVLLFVGAAARASAEPVAGLDAGVLAPAMEVGAGRPTDGGVPPSFAGPEADAGSAPDGGAPPVFVVVKLEANKPAAELAPGLGQTLVHRIAAAGFEVREPEDVARQLGPERQKELNACEGAARACWIGPAAEAGAGFLVAGRLDRFGDRYLLNLTVSDTRDGRIVVQSHQEADEAGELPHALGDASDALLVHFGVKPKPAPTFSPAEPSGVNFRLGVGSQLITSVARLAPVVQMELGYRVMRAWEIFLQLSAAFTFDSTSTVELTPGLLGVRYYFRSGKSLQPTLGTGLGVLSTIGTFEGKTRPSLLVLGGLEWFPIDRLGVGLEASLDLLGLAYDFGNTNKSGVNLGLSLAVMYRF